MTRSLSRQVAPPDWSAETLQLIDAAYREDFDDAGDITSALLPAESNQRGGGAGRVVARCSGVICGLALAPTICAVFGDRLNSALGFSPAESGAEEIVDGDLVAAGQAVATLRGPRGALLSVERTLLNFLSRMSGVATRTRTFVDAAAEINPLCRIYDTRKTIPGWRELDKYAVRCGGGHNHRAGLYDAVLIKDNHLAGIPRKRLAAAVAEMLAKIQVKPAFIEVEVDDPEQFREVCGVGGVDVVLLDNFSVQQMRAAVRHRDEQGLRGRLALEASGGVTLDNVAEIAATGVDRIAVGALTHSAPALDLGLDVVG
jgi:nicotinate-nucleotide pyrophosphorylase (carboxylating)